MRGITPVIAVILLLLITVAVVGFSFTYFSSVQQSTSVAVQKGIKNFPEQTGGAFVIEGNKIRNNSYKIFIRNVAPKTSAGFLFTCKN